MTALTGDWMLHITPLTHWISTCKLFYDSSCKTAVWRAGREKADTGTDGPFGEGKSCWHGRSQTSTPLKSICASSKGHNTDGGRAEAFVPRQYVFIQSIWLLDVVGVDVGCEMLSGRCQPVKVGIMGSGDKEQSSCMSEWHGKFPTHLTL